MKAGIIGCGAIADVHIEALTKQGIEIAALCDIDKCKAEVYKNKYKLNSLIYSDFRVMLKEEALDVVHITSPHYLHAEMSVCALERGINVLCEKPLGISAQDIDAIRYAARKSTAQYGVCFQNRYLPANCNLKKMCTIDGGAIGGSASVMWHRAASYYTESNWKGTWEHEGGGVMINQAIHSLDLLIWIMGMPNAVTATISNHSLNDIIEVEDTAEGYFEGQSNFVFYATNACPISEPARLSVYTNKHTYLVEGSNFYIDGKLTEDSTCEREQIRDKSYWGTGHEMLISDYYNCIRQGKVFPIGIEAGAKALIAVLAIYRSKGKKIKIEE